MPRSLSELNCSISRAAELLRCGGIVAIPTETVYGLGADATNVTAVAKIFGAKNRPTFDPLIVHLADKSQISSVVNVFPGPAQRLADAFWPGPLTIVLPKRDIIPDLVTAGLPGVGVRVPAHPIARELLRQAGCPIAAPSANPFGGISPTTAQHVVDGLGDAIDGIVDGGPCDVGLESTVVSFMADRPIVLRPGGLPIEDIERVIGQVDRAVSDPSRDDSAQPAPGMLSRHYAPRTPLILIGPDDPAVPTPGLRSALLTWHDSDPGVRRLDAALHQLDFAIIKTLSAANPSIQVAQPAPILPISPDKLMRCAAEFFASLRDLDSSGVDVIIARLFPDFGLGVALNDRLRRAAGTA